MLIYTKIDSTQILNNITESEKTPISVWYIKKVNGPVLTVEFPPHLIPKLGDSFTLRSCYTVRLIKDENLVKTKIWAQEESNYSRSNPNFTWNEELGSIEKINTKYAQVLVDDKHYTYSLLKPGKSLYIFETPALNPLVIVDLCSHFDKIAL